MEGYGGAGGRVADTKGREEALGEVGGAPHQGPLTPFSTSPPSPPPPSGPWRGRRPRQTDSIVSARRRRHLLLLLLVRLLLLLFLSATQTPGSGGETGWGVGVGEGEGDGQMNTMKSLTRATLTPATPPSSIHLWVRISLFPMGQNCCPLLLAPV